MRNKYYILAIILFSFIFLISNVTALECEEFVDEVPIWSSSYNGNAESTNYYAWNIKNKCPSTDCFMKNINAKVRVLDFEGLNKGIGYVQVSDTEESNCNEPQKATYTKYVAYQTGKEESEFLWSCGAKKENNLCMLTKENNFKEPSCLSVKVSGTNSQITDLRAIKYTWCWKDTSKSSLTGYAIKSLKASKYQTLSVLAIVLAIALLTTYKFRRKNGS